MVRWGQEGEQGASHFVRKTDDGSAALYFHYYGMLQHQQNMLQDYVRTGTYYSAILNNAPDFYSKTVMDVGAGSGILSLFAAQAWAPHSPAHLGRAFPPCTPVLVLSLRSTPSPRMTYRMRTVVGIGSQLAR